MGLYFDVVFRVVEANVFKLQVYQLGVFGKCEERPKGVHVVQCNALRQGTI